MRRNRDGAFIKEECPLPYIRVMAEKGEKLLVTFGGREQYWCTPEMLKACIAVQEAFND